MKQHRSLAIFASAALMLSAQLHVFAGSVGDLDSNGAVDAVDASAILLRAAEIGTGGTADADEMTLMDINGDNQITAVDASHLLTYAARFGTGEITQNFEEYVALRQEEPVLYGSDSKAFIFGSVQDGLEFSDEKGYVITTASELEEFNAKLIKGNMNVINTYNAEWFETHSLFVMLTYEFSMEPYYEATAITADENNNWTIAMYNYYFPYESPMCPGRVTVVETNKGIEFAASICLDITPVLTDDMP